MRFLPLLFVLAACRSAVRPPTPSEPPPDPNAPQVTLYGVRLVSFRGGERFASGRAVKVTYERLSSDFVATEALMRFPSRAGGVKAPKGALAGLEVRAPVASGSLPRRVARGEGGVVMRTSSGITARTERVDIDAAQERAWGETPVEVRGEGYALDADAFELSLADERFTFVGHVKSRLGGKP